MNNGSMLPFHLLKPKAIFHKKSSDDVSIVLDSMQVGSSSDPKEFVVSGYAANVENAYEDNDKKNGTGDSHELTQEMSDQRAESLIQDDQKEFPDGGREAWLVVFGSFMGLLPVFGLINSLGAIESYISINQLASESSSIISWIFSIYLAISFMSCILAGGYFDRNGSRDPMVFGTVIFTGGMVATANCNTVWEFLLSFSVVVGTASGILMTPLVSVIATYFLRKRAIATSAATAGGSIGGIIFPILLRKLYGEVGFQWAMRIVALICAVCLTIATLIVHEREKPVSEPFKSKKEMVVWYYNSSFNWRYFLEPRYLFATLGSSFAESSLTATTTYIASYALVRGNSQTVSYALITTMNAVGILGRYIPGYLADKWVGRFNIAIVTIFLAAILNLIIWLPFGGITGALWAFSMLYGFASGSILSLTPVCIGQISRTTDFGKRYSTAYFQQAVITIPVIPICGALIGDRSVSGFNHFIIFVSILMLLGSFCYMVARYLCVGFKLTKF